MSFDIEPDGDPHGECKVEIFRLSQKLERALNALSRISKYYDGTYDRESCLGAAYTASKAIDDIEKCDGEKIEQ